MVRGTARAFAYDTGALALTLSGMQSGAEAALDPVERMFFYMPLQHAESREAQDESVAAYRRLLAEAPQPLYGPFAAHVSFKAMSHPCHASPRQVRARIEIELAAHLLIQRLRLR